MIYDQFGKMFVYIRAVAATSPPGLIKLPNSYIYPQLKLQEQHLKCNSLVFKTKECRRLKDYLNCRQVLLLNFWIPTWPQKAKGSWKRSGGIHTNVPEENVSNWSPAGLLLSIPASHNPPESNRNQGRTSLHSQIYLQRGGKTVREEKANFFFTPSPQSFRSTSPLCSPLQSQ